MFSRMLKHAQVWSPEHAQSYTPFRYKEGNVSHALTQGEQERWLMSAKRKEKWNWVYWYRVLGLSAPASSVELRSLRIEDINFHGTYIQIRRESAKTKYRIRTIPLTEPGFEAAYQLVQRARTLGCVEPWHYVFPSRVTPNRYDPTRPMSAWGVRTWWDEIRIYSGLRHFP